MLRNCFYYFFGIIILFINKIRYGFFGYKKPRDFPVSAMEKAIKYDQSVVDGWLINLKQYEGMDIKDKTVLELGPGADLGIALLLLNKGAKKYTALDVNNLVETVPELFYEKLLESINNKELISALKDKNKINYICDKNFNISKINIEDSAIIFSQAAFEHFSDPEKALEQLSQTAKSGAILIAEVDLQTHTKWLREKDPLNIYRYANNIYNLFHFSGIPNRIRPQEYKKILEKNNWKNVVIKPKNILSGQELKKISPRLAEPFNQESAQMQTLSFILCATKK
ncbi:MAG: methyltransferase domain-containing protein [Patescibacteria group bacterium]|jgi:SAM-dependent methyltransferase